MQDEVIARELLRRHFESAAALIALMLKNLPEDLRTRTLNAMHNGTGKVELRTRVESNETEPVFVPVTGGEPLSIARTTTLPRENAE
jgi:hypothetical protein